MLVQSQNAEPIPHPACRRSINGCGGDRPHDFRLSVWHTLNPGRKTKGETGWKTQRDFLSSAFQSGNNRIGFIRNRRDWHPHLVEIRTLPVSDPLAARLSRCPAIPSDLSLENISNFIRTKDAVLLKHSYNLSHQIA